MTELQAKGRRMVKSQYLREQAIEAAVNGEAVLYTAHTARESHEAFQLVVTAVQDTPAFDRAYYTNGNNRVHFHSGGRILFNCYVRGAGKGFRPDLQCMDDVPAECLVVGARRVLR